MQEPITLIMPMYRRWTLVQKSIKCFLNQTYPNRQLLILNDDPGHPLSIDAPNIQVFNLPERMILGKKRQWLLDRVETDLVGSWDSDDLMYPDYLSTAIAQIEESAAIKVNSAWKVYGSYDEPVLEDGFPETMYDGTIIFRRSKAKNITFRPTNIGEAVPFYNYFLSINQLKAMDTIVPLFVYTWYLDSEHASWNQNIIIQDSDVHGSQTYTESDFLNVDIPEFQMIQDSGRWPT